MGSIFEAGEEIAQTVGESIVRVTDARIFAEREGGARGFNAQQIENLGLAYLFKDLPGEIDKINRDRANKGMPLLQDPQVML